VQQLDLLGLKGVLKNILLFEVFHLNNKKAYCLYIDAFVKSRICPYLSFLRKQESSDFKDFWTPAFAGVTELRLFTNSSILNENKEG
jgi:hypothetical protein